MHFRMQPKAKWVINKIGNRKHERSECEKHFHLATTSCEAAWDLSQRKILSEWVQKHLHNGMFRRTERKLGAHFFSVCENTRDDDRVKGIHSQMEENEVIFDSKFLMWKSRRAWFNAIFPTRKNSKTEKKLNLGLKWNKREEKSFFSSWTLNVNHDVWENRLVKL